MSERPVAARGLVKRYGHVLAIDGVDLTVDSGDVYGFLGPNGAGKTTTLRILLGLIRPDAGSVRLFGRDPHDDTPAALDGVGGFVEEPRFYPYLSGRKNLELLAAFDGVPRSPRIGEALELVDLYQRGGDRVGGYSQGMRQRLGELCNRVAIVRDGRIVYEGKIDDLHGGRANRYRLRATDHDRARAVLEGHHGVESVVDDGAELTFSADETAVVELSRALVGAGLGISALIPEAASLEALFFELTEDRPRQEAAA
jgi:ABC-2 type transport system ATP-binding protein